MPYVELSNLLLTTSYKAKELTLLEFNSILAKIKVQLDTINTNMEYVKDNSVVTDYEIDAITTAIAHPLEYNHEQVFSAEATEAIIIIPDTVAHGFYSTVVFNTGDPSFEVAFTNYSTFTGDHFKILRKTYEISSYTPPVDSTITLMVFCDGINVYICVYEVS